MRIDYATPEHACRQPNITVMDHMRGLFEFPGVPVINRVCLTCKTHWYGEAGAAVTEIPQKIWDRWMEVTA